MSKDFNNSRFPKYNSLKDPYLRDYYSKPIVRSHLIKTGLISKSGFIIPEDEWKHNLFKSERIEKASRTIADEIVRNVVHFEKLEKADYIREQDELAKKELIRKTRNRDNDHYLPLLNLSKRSSSENKHNTLSLKNESRSLSVNNQQQQQLKPKPLRKRLAPIKRDEPTLTRDPSTITIFYNSNAFDLKESNYRDEVKIYQQEVGGENILVYSGLHKAGDKFEFQSKVPKEFPSNLTIFVNGSFDSRITSDNDTRIRSNLKSNSGRFSVIDEPEDDLVRVYKSKQLDDNDDSDQKLYLYLIARNIETERIWLSKNNCISNNERLFNNGNCDEFEIEISKNIKNLRWIRVGYEGTNDLKLEKIAIIKQFNSEFYEFKSNNKNFNFNEIILPLSDSSNETNNEKKIESKKYLVRVYTLPLETNLEPLVENQDNNQEPLSDKDFKISVDIEERRLSSNSRVSSRHSALNKSLSQQEKSAFDEDANNELTQIQKEIENENERKSSYSRSSYSNQSKRSSRSSVSSQSSKQSSRSSKSSKQSSRSSRSSKTSSSSISRSSEESENEQVNNEQSNSLEYENEKFEDDVVQNVEIDVKNLDNLDKVEQNDLSLQQKQEEELSERLLTPKIEPRTIDNLVESEQTENNQELVDESNQNLDEPLDKVENENFEKVEQQVLNQAVVDHQDDSLIQNLDEEIKNVDFNQEEKTERIVLTPQIEPRTIHNLVESEQTENNQDFEERVKRERNERDLEKERLRDETDKRLGEIMEGYERERKEKEQLFLASQQEPQEPQIEQNDLNQLEANQQEDNSRQLTPEKQLRTYVDLTDTEPALEQEVAQENNLETAVDNQETQIENQVENETEQEERLLTPVNLETPTREEADNKSQTEQNVEQTLLQETEQVESVESSTNENQNFEIVTETVQEIVENLDTVEVEKLESQELVDTQINQEEALEQIEPASELNNENDQNLVVETEKAVEQEIENLPELEESKDLEENTNQEEQLVVENEQVESNLNQIVNTDETIETQTELVQDENVEKEAESEPVQEQINTAEETQTNDQELATSVDQNQEVQGVEIQSEQRMEKRPSEISEVILNNILTVNQSSDTNQQF